jgi:hypothetical protein
MRHRGRRWHGVMASRTGRGGEITNGGETSASGNTWRGGKRLGARKSVNALAHHNQFNGAHAACASSRGACVNARAAPAMRRHQRAWRQGDSGSEKAAKIGKRVSGGACRQQRNGKRREISNQREK